MQKKKKKRKKKERKKNKKIGYQSLEITLRRRNFVLCDVVIIFLVLSFAIFMADLLILLVKVCS